MSLSSNFPAIRPSLLLDFQKSRAVDPRITFTRASTATYFDDDGILQSALANVPRIDFNPSTLVCNGLLIEEQRTNSFPNSNDFSNTTYWRVSGTAVVTAGAGTGPDNLTSASNLAGATNTTFSGNNLDDAISISASTAYTFSVFVKSNGGTEVVLRMRDSTGGSGSTSVLTVTSAWQRISLTRTMAVGATSVNCIIGQTNGDILIYGAQLEAGEFATSYIPTTTTALTRNADVASMTGTDFSSWYNAVEGTVFVSAQFTESVALKTIYEINDNTTSNHIRATVNASVTTPIFQVSNVTAQAAITLGSAALNVFLMTNAYKVDDFSAALGGTLGTPDTSGSLPTVTQLTIGRRITDRYLNGYIRRIAYYPVRLPNAQLQALTG
jgi:hypothetical protein